MEGLGEILRVFLNMSCAAVQAIFIVVILRLILCRAPKGFSYVLWGPVLFRLLCPVTPLTAKTSVMRARVTEWGGLDYLSDLTIGRHGEISGVAAGSGAALASSNHTGAVGMAMKLKQLLPVLALVWLLGIAVLAGYSIWSMLRLGRRVECSMQLRDNIYLADHISTPFVLGILRPRIYLPSDLGEEEREYVLLHEQYHIRRRDYLVKMLAFLVLCLHWFNPFVWLAFVLAGRDMEMSCDEGVMRRGNRDVRREYADALLHLSTGRRSFTGTPLAFGEGDPKQRIQNIMRYKRPAILVSVVAGIVCILAVIAILSNPASDRSGMRWAQSLTVEEIEKAELVVFSQVPEKQYRNMEREDFEELVELIQSSRGRLLTRHEEVDGGSIFFYITTKDGMLHEIGNIGNLYLYIDGEYYDAGYDWLSGQRWEAYYNAGSDYLPDGFLGEDIENVASVEFKARILEMGDGFMLVEPAPDSLELSSADRISLPVRNVSSARELKAGDWVEIRYDGSIMESYPAQLGRVYEITLLEKYPEP